MSFDAGSLVFKILTQGRQAAEQDLNAAQSAFEKTGTSAETAAGKLDKQATATEGTAKSAKTVKAPLTEQASVTKTAGDAAQDTATKQGQQASSTKDVGDKSETAAKKQDTQAASSEKQASAASKVGTAMLAAGVAIGALVTTAIATYADFDQQMSNTSAAVMATSLEQETLSEAALKAGADTAYSATEAAAAEEELAKAGQSVSDIVGGSLNGALSLAAAGQLGVADAATIMASSLTQFGLSASDSTHVADLLAAGAGKAQGSVDDLGQALNNVGNVASNTGYSIEETTGFLAAMASYGLTGAEAGTQLKSMLQSLQAPSSVAKAAMDKLGLSLYDSAGNTKSLTQFVGEYQASLTGKTQAEKDSLNATIFGSYGIQAATVAYKEGSDGIQSWIDAVDDSGYAAEQAAARQDNLAGDIEKLGGSFETAMIGMGEAADGPLRTIVQGITNVINEFTDMSDWSQQSVLWIGAVASAVMIAGGVFLVAVPKIAAYKTAIAELGPAAQTTSKLVGTAFKVMGAAAAGVAILTAVDQVVDALNGANASSDELTAAFTATTKTAESMWATVGKGRTELGLAGASLDDLQASLDHLNGGDYNAFSFFFASDDVRNTADRLVEVGKNLATIASTDMSTAIEDFQSFAAETDGTEESVWSLIQIMPDFKSQLIAAATEAGTYSESMSDSEKKAALLSLAQSEVTDSTSDNTEALAALSGQAADTSDSISDLADQIKDFGSATLDTRSAQRDFEQALDDLQDSISENGSSLDIATEQGRDNQSAIDDLAQSTLDYSSALLTQTGDQDAAAAAIQNGRDQLINMLSQFGITGQAAQDYANQLGLIPSNVTTAAEVTGVDYSEEQLQQLTRDRYTYIYPVVSQSPLAALVGATGEADGSVLRFYGNGGVAESHVAQIAPAGTWRVWAEDETGGEAYIPLAQSKRGRSTQILADVATQFGYQLVPAGVQSYADGSAGGSGAVSLDGVAIKGTLQIAGDGLTAYVDGRIASTDRASYVALTSGSASR